MTKLEFVNKVIELNSSLPENMELTLYVHKDHFAIMLQNEELPYSERTLYSQYSIPFDRLDKAMKHLQIEIDAL